MSKCDVINKSLTPSILRNALITHQVLLIPRRTRAQSWVDNWMLPGGGKNHSLRPRGRWFAAARLDTLEWTLACSRIEWEGVRDGGDSCRSPKWVARGCRVRPDCSPQNPPPAWREPKYSPPAFLPSSAHDPFPSLSPKCGSPKPDLVCAPPSTLLSSSTSQVSALLLRVFLPIVVV
jgi:hypothetical protein